MICKIADLGVDIPDVGNMLERSEAYKCSCKADIVLEKEKMSSDFFPNLSVNDNYYLDSGFMFYRKLLAFQGMMLHSSAVVVDGFAYLFSGPCGIGKSTHTALWQEEFGESAVIINDDKPALRLIDGKWIAFGTPWCGKNGINQNMSAPLAGICFLHRGDTLIKRLDPLEALPLVLMQTNGTANMSRAKLFTPIVDSLLTNIPVFEFYNHAQSGDARITYEAMYNAKIYER